MLIPCFQIASTSEIESVRLFTGLIVASEAIIKCILGQILGISSSEFCRLQLKEGTTRVVHYPFADNPPVLQAMNSSGTALLS